MAILEVPGTLGLRKGVANLWEEREKEMRGENRKEGGRKGKWGMSKGKRKK